MTRSEYTKHGSRYNMHCLFELYKLFIKPNKLDNDALLLRFIWTLLLQFWWFHNFWQPCDNSIDKRPGYHVYLLNVYSYVNIFSSSSVKKLSFFNSLHCYHYDYLQNTKQLKLDLKSGHCFPRFCFWHPSLFHTTFPMPLFLQLLPASSTSCLREIRLSAVPSLRPRTNPSVNYEVLHLNRILSMHVILNKITVVTN